MLKDESEPASDRIDVVFKDSWIDKDCIPEYETLYGVREKFKHDPGLQHFLSAKCVGIVQRCDWTPGTTNSSVCNLHRLGRLDFRKNIDVKSNVALSTRMGVRRHRRVVFPKVGVPLTELTSYSSLLDALYGSLCGM
jgi:hypothetical protein